MTERLSAATISDARQLGLTNTVADALTDAYAEIDALRSELEAMRPLPAESMALTVALAQMLRGDTPTPNVSTVVMWAAARMAGMATFDPDLGYVPASRSVRNGE